MLITILAAQALAAPTWSDPEPFSADPSDLTALVASLEDDAPHIFLDEDTYQYDDQGRETHTSRMIYTVLDPDQLNMWSRVETQWSPWLEERPQIKARVITPDGTVHWLDEALLEDAANGRNGLTYSDRRTLLGILPGFVAGSVVEEVIVHRDHTPFLGGGAYHVTSTANYADTDLRRVRVEVAPGWSVRHELTADGRARPLKKGQRGLLLELESPEQHDYAPYWPHDVLPAGLFVFSTAPSWKTIGSAYHELVAPSLSADGITHLVDRVKSKATDRAKAAMAYAIARDEVRYTSVSFGARSIVPTPPAEMMERGYGDCKDKASLLITLLQQVGIDARFVLLRRQSHMMLSAGLTGANQFDHAIVYVPSLDLYLDPTGDEVPLGELPWDIQGSQALLIDSDAPRLVLLPQSSSMANLLRETVEADIPSEGGARLIETTEGWGWNGTDMRREYPSTFDGDYQEGFTDYLAETFGDATLTSAGLDTSDDAHPRTRLTLEAANAGTMLSDGTEAAAAIVPYAVLRNSPSFIVPFDEAGARKTPEQVEEELAGRTEDVEVVPFRDEFVARIRIAPGFELSQVPEEMSWTGPSGTEVSRRVTRDGEHVQLTYVVDGGDGRWTVAETKAMREAVTELMDDTPLLVLWMASTYPLLNQGSYHQAFESLDALVRELPEDSAYRSWRAHAFLEAGLGALAQREARAALAQDDSPARHADLGYMLLHDEWGRNQHWPYDRDQAIAHLRTAVAGDPTLDGTRENLALALVHQPLPGGIPDHHAELEEAADHFRVLVDRDHDGAMFNLMTVLLKLGRHEEAMELGRGQELDDMMTLSWLAHYAMAEGADAFMREVRRRRTGMGPQQTAATVAVALLTVGHHERALELFEQVARLPGRSPEVTTLVDALARALRTDLHRLPDREISLLAEYRLDTIASVADTEILGRHFATTPFVPPELVDFHKGFRIGWESTDEGLPIEVTLGMQYADAEIQRGPRTRAGYRVDILSEGRSWSMFVAKKKGRFQILGHPYAPTFTAYQAQQLLQRGDEETALALLGLMASPFRGDDGTYGTNGPLGRWWTGGEHTAERAEALIHAILVAQNPQTSLPGLQAWLDTNPSEKDAIVLLDIARRAKGLTPDAELQIGRHIERFEPDTDRGLWIQMAAARDGGFTDTLQALTDRAMAADLQSYTLSLALIELGRVDEGLAMHEALLSTRPDDPSTLNNHAWMLAAQGRDLPRAIELAQAAVDGADEPDLSDMHTLATVLALHGDVDRALAVTREAAQQPMFFEHEPYYRAVLSILTARLGHLDAARELLAGAGLPAGGTLEMATDALDGMTAQARNDAP